MMTCNCVRHAKYKHVIWGKVAVAVFLSPVLSRFNFVFTLSQFRGPDYLGARNRLLHIKGFQCPLSSLQKRGLRFNFGNGLSLWFLAIKAAKIVENLFQMCVTSAKRVKCKNSCSSNVLRLLIKRRCFSEVAFSSDLSKTRRLCARKCSVKLVRIPHFRHIKGNRHNLRALRFLRSFGWTSATYDWLTVALNTIDLQKLQGEWVKALDEVISGIV